ncbi:MAG: cytochrome c maturation protein CcmE [Saprospirales bacterium]|nr:MAG: cytochrome c maturation protein CcmE [Saprospirales bacterium]
MKKIHLVAGLLLAGAVVLLVISSSDLGTYYTFAEAELLEDDRNVKIIGLLSKDKEMIYRPEIDPNRFTFYMTDEAGEERMVVLLSEKPQDFEMSEQLVLTGRFRDGVFVAREMLMKCPSKYQDEEIFVRSEI